ncbi:MAG: Maf family protein [Acidobacteriota bacterium]|nr:Maf family protein [Acidobacteriota bacterium]
MPAPDQPPRLILASSSPRRRELLAQAGYTFTVEAADVDESLHHGEEPAAYVRRLAEKKAEAVFARHAQQPSGLLVLAADTSVVCDGRILGKPADAADAERMLRMLSARAHTVLTGIAARHEHGNQSAVEQTEVTFDRIPEGELALYCATSEPLDKAGAYGIQGFAARWIPRIDGCYFNVMGLPIARTVELIHQALSSLNAP